MSIMYRFHPGRCSYCNKPAVVSYNYWIRLVTCRNKINSIIRGCEDHKQVTEDHVIEISKNYPEILDSKRIVK
jgi:hypothetical protein